MIPTNQIKAAIQKVLEESTIVEKVITSSDSDLASNLERLRDVARSLIVIVPGQDEFETDFVEGENIPLCTRMHSAFDLLISGRNLNMTDAGDDATLAAKDALVDLLMWHDLGLPELVVIPISCPPLVVEFPEGGIREAWQFTISVRQIIHI